MLCYLYWEVRNLEIGDRIKKIRIDKNLNQSEFAEYLGIGQAALSSLEKGIRNVTDRNIFLICENFNVNENWLRTGEGDMFIQPDTFSLDEYAKKSNLSELEIVIMKGYMDLDQDVRKKWLKDVEDYFRGHLETAATTQQSEEDDIESEIDEEIELYRQELLAEKKARTSSASEKRETS